MSDDKIITQQKLNINALFETDGEYSFRSGFNPCALIAMVLGVLAALIGKWVPALDFLFSLSWFTGFVVAFGVYYFLMKKAWNTEGVIQYLYKGQGKLSL